MPSRLIAALTSPGTLSVVVVSAPTKISDKKEDSIDLSLNSKHEAGVDDPAMIFMDDHSGSEILKSGRILKALDGERRRGRFNRYLDIFVSWSGSPWAFAVWSGLLIAWAAMGIAGWGSDPTWNVLISDVQAISCYVIDTLLVRQQFNNHDDLLITIGVLRSRNASIERMLRLVQRPPVLTDSPVRSSPEPVVIDVSLPRGNWFSRAVKLASSIAGSLYTLVAFWIGIVIWIAFGPSLEWSDEWQLYMNSSSSALLLFVFAFLSCVRESHTRYLSACTERISTTDVAVEQALRQITGDHEANPQVVIPAPPVGRLQRVINYYAEVVGSLSGLVLLVAVLIIWAAFGPLLEFGTNWWLLIGTYAGLIGMQDGFVIRCMDHEMHIREADLLAKVDAADERCQSLIPREKVNNTSSTAKDISTLSRIYRSVNRFTIGISQRIGSIIAHRFTVVACVILIVALLVAATAMNWSLTGQLICNVPPSIIESFVMLVLITGHNLNDKKVRNELAEMLERRAVLLAYAAHLKKYGVNGDVRFAPIIIGRHKAMPKVADV